MDAPVIVTGASGFIGRHLVRHFAEHCVPTIALTRRTPVRHCQSGLVEYVQVRNYESFVPHSNAVMVHLAEPPHIAEVDALGDTHVERMQRQAIALAGRGYRRIVYASSATVYGDGCDHLRCPDEPVSGEHKVYARAKLAVEKIISDAGGVNARITNIYGTGMAETSILVDILKQLPNDGPITIRETTPIRDYLWIDDLAHALAAMAVGKAAGIYNVGTGFAISCGDLTRLVLQISVQSERPVQSILPPRRSILRLDIGKTMADFGWSSKTDLATGIATLLGRYNP